MRGEFRSVAAITTSFLGAQALGEGSSAWAWLAIAGFVGAAVASLAILWPRRWELTTDPRRVIKTYIEAGEPALIDDVRHDLSLYMHRSFVENKEGLERLTILFQIASVLLTVEVVLWIAPIAPNRSSIWHRRRPRRSLSRKEARVRCSRKWRASHRSVSSSRSSSTSTESRRSDCYAVSRSVSALKASGRIALPAAVTPLPELP